MADLLYDFSEFMFSKSTQIFQYGEKSLVTAAVTAPTKRQKFVHFEEELSVNTFDRTFYSYDSYCESFVRESFRTSYIPIPDVFLSEKSVATPLYRRLTRTYIHNGRHEKTTFQRWKSWFHWNIKLHSSLMRSHKGFFSDKLDIKI